MTSEGEWTTVIGRGLRALREEYGLSQTTVAEIANRVGLGWSRSIVDSVERGQRGATIPEVLSLAQLVAVMHLEHATDARTRKRWETTSPRRAMYELVRSSGHSGVPPFVQALSSEEEETEADDELETTDRDIRAMARIGRWEDMSASEVDAIVSDATGVAFGTLHAQLRQRIQSGNVTSTDARRKATEVLGAVVRWWESVPLGAQPGHVEMLDNINAAMRVSEVHGVQPGRAMENVLEDWTNTTKEES